MIAEVVKIDPEHDGRIERVGDRLYGVHECVFAMEAPIRIVHLIGGILHLVGENLSPVEAPLSCEVSAIVSLIFGQRRRDCRDGNNTICTESVVGHIGKKRRVDTPAERHHNPFKRTKFATQRFQLFHATSVLESPRSSTVGTAICSPGSDPGEQISRLAKWRLGWLVVAEDAAFNLTESGQLRLELRHVRRHKVRL